MKLKNITDGDGSTIISILHEENRVALHSSGEDISLSRIYEWFRMKKITNIAFETKVEVIKQSKHTYL